METDFPSSQQEWTKGNKNFKAQISVRRGNENVVFQCEKYRVNAS